MTAKEAINYLDKPVSFKNIPSLRLNIDDGVYILSEIQQNWRNEGGRRRIKSQFLISDIINPCVGYWVNPETVTEFNGEIEIDCYGDRANAAEFSSSTLFAEMKGSEEISEKSEKDTDIE